MKRKRAGGRLLVGVGCAIICLALFVVLPVWPQLLDPSDIGRSIQSVEDAGKIAYIGNRAWRYPQGGSQRTGLHLGSKVYVRDAIMSEGGPLEIELLDGSALRIAAGSRVELTEALFSSDDDSVARSVSVRVLVGRAWATVSGAIRGDDKFEVRTQTAAAGVRGTSFRVDARQDTSTLVRVYQGAVAVRGLEQVKQPDPKPTERRQVQGPAQITREEWEQRVEAMMGVEVSAAGQVGQPVAFDPDADRQDPWVDWNMQRDAGR